MSRGTQDTTQERTCFSLQGYYLLWPDLSRSLQLPRSFVTPYRMSYNPKRQASSVWAIPLSLAATKGISFDFSSSGYLDVSVPRVVFHHPMYSGKDTIPLPCGFPHSEISGSKPAYGSPKLIGC